MEQALKRFVETASVSPSFPAQGLAHRFLAKLRELLMGPTRPNWAKLGNPHLLRKFRMPSSAPLFRHAQNASLRIALLATYHFDSSLRLARFLKLVRALVFL